MACQTIAFDTSVRRHELRPIKGRFRLFRDNLLTLDETLHIFILSTTERAPYED